MAFSERIVNFQRLLCGRSRLREGIFRGHIGCDGQTAIRFGQSEVSQGIIGIEINRLLIKANCRPDLRRNELGVMITSSEKKLIGVDIVSVTFR